MKGVLHHILAQAVGSRRILQYDHRACRHLRYGQFLLVSLLLLQGWSHWVALVTPDALTLTAPLPISKNDSSQP